LAWNWWHGDLVSAKAKSPCYQWPYLYWWCMLYDVWTRPDDWKLSSVHRWLVCPAMINCFLTNYLYTPSTSTHACVTTTLIIVWVARAYLVS
jgi:hypothetical protein